MLKKEINDTFIEAQQSFVATPLPVPDGSNITFCDQIDLSVIDDLSKDIAGLARIGLFILIGVILVLIIAYAAIQWYTQRSLLNGLRRARDQWFPDYDVGQSDKSIQRWEPTEENLLIMHAYVEHPLWSRFIYALSGRFNWSRETTNALGWFGAYVFHQAAMVCLMVGVLGLLAVQLQLLVARPLQAQYSAQVTTAINDLSNTIASSVNATMASHSKQYADDLNALIDATQSTINVDLFGWVNGTTTQLNATLVAFYEDVQDVVDKVFGNTPLSAPAQDFLRCILGNKITTIEKALTFLHDNLIIDIPRVRTDVLMLSQGSVDEVVRPISAAAVGSGGNNGDEGVINKLVNAYIRVLEKERIKFVIFLLIWLAVCAVAGAVVAWHLWGQQIWWTARRKRWEKKSGNFDGTQFSVIRISLRSDAGFGLAGGVTPWQPNSERESPTPLVTKNEKATPEGLISFTPFGDKRPVLSLNRGPQEHLRQRRTSNPNVPRSWDDMLDAREKQQDGAGAGKLATTLMNIGKRATRIGKSPDTSLPTVNYGNVPPPPPTDSDDNSSIWIKRLTFWKKPEAPDVPLGVTVPHSRTGSLVDGYDFGVAPPRRHRKKPSLTINTQRASNAPGLPVPMSAIVDVSPNSPKATGSLSATTTGPGPQTAKSGHVWDMVVPPAPPLPVADPRKLVISPPRPLQPRKVTLPTRPNQHLPLKLDHRSLRSGDTLIPSSSTSVGSVHASNRSVPPKAPVLPSMSTTTMPIPLRYNFPNSSVPPPPPSSNLSPLRTPDTPRHERKHERTPSSARLLTPSQSEKQPQPARHSSIAVDPFADNMSVSHTPSANPFSTPFDDSNALKTSRPRTARRSPSPPGLDPPYGLTPGTPGKAF